jgi:shikimate kinase
MAQLVYLIGMMGAGKTTLGKELASLISYPFVDLDVYIEKQANKQVREIFAEEGETHFRRMEACALRDIPQAFPRAVVATGGGAPCFHDNITFMKSTGFTVFLDVPVAALVRRLQSSDLRERPLLSGKSQHELTSHLEGILLRRQDTYLQAHHVFDGVEGQVEELGQAARLFLNENI